MFYRETLQKLLAEGTLATNDRVLVVCGGRTDERVFHELGFTNVTVTNLNNSHDGDITHFAWAHQDAENLTYADGTFDVVVEHKGLHHCFSPHRALLEMYRVASKLIVVFENRDSFALRAAKALGLTTDYEIEAVFGGSKGVANLPIPNFVYRWTEPEVVKTIKSNAPGFEPHIRFFYGLQLPHQRMEQTGNRLGSTALKLAGPLAAAALKLFPRQGNEFGFVVAKGGRLQPWLKTEDGALTLDRSYAVRTGRAYGGVKAEV